MRRLLVVMAILSFAQAGAMSSITGLLGLFFVYSLKRSESVSIADGFTAIGAALACRSPMSSLRISSGLILARQWHYPCAALIWLFSLAAFHTHIVFGLAYLRRIIFRAGLL